MGDNDRRYPQRRRIPAFKDYARKEAAATKTNRWTHEEQMGLASNLLKYGDRDVNVLGNVVEKKGTPRVYNYLMQHKDEANKSDKSTDNNESDRLESLKAWIKYMRGKKQKYPTPSPIALTMLMMSLYEDHPVPTDGEVSFPEAYEYLFRLFSQRHVGNFSKLSAPTKKFVQLSILSLMKESTENIDKHHQTFVESANVDKKETSSVLPDDINNFLLRDHFNPLDLDELIVKPN